MEASAALHGERGRGGQRERELVELPGVCVCMYVGWRELSTQHDSPAGVTAYLRAARAAAWRSLSSLPASPSAFRRSDRASFCTRLRAVMSKCGSTVDGWDCFFLRNDLSHPEVFETFR